MPKLAVLASGEGTTLQAILDYPLKVDRVITDRPCRAAAIAADAGIPVFHVNRSAIETFDAAAREEFSRRVAEILRDFIWYDVAAMAGFKTVLGSVFFSRFRGRLLNVHPSLLPAFPGPHAVQGALAAGVATTGCTIHEATMVVDCGKIFAQAEVPVVPGDTVETLHGRIKAEERRLYPPTIVRVQRGAA